MKKKIYPRVEVKHPNGYRGILYGKSSMSIYYEDKEVLHSGSCTPKTKDELFECLENMPRFFEMLFEERAEC